MAKEYTTGQQPCQDFKSKDEFNVHECFAPFDKGGPRCAETGGRVSFCEHCHCDHHSGGYETCAGRKS